MLKYKKETGMIREYLDISSLYDKIIDKNIDANIFIDDGLSQVGGGSMPLETIKTKVVAITPKNMSVSSLE